MRSMTLPLALPLVTFAVAAVIATHLQASTSSTVQAGLPQGGESRLSELWVEPEPTRDLYYGVGGRAMMPSPTARFTVLKMKKGGFSDGYDVRSPDGREWSAKLYPEARTEVVASRLQWGVGYHQPPIYTVETWSAEGAPTEEDAQPVARFREKQPAALNGLAEDEPWSYTDNPFLGTRPLNGLIVLQVMLTNADLKADNNMQYTLERPLEGATRWWVARDLGQTFGRTGMLSALRDDPDAFDRTRFILGVKDGMVEFEYFGPHVGLTKTLTPGDVRWICQRLSRLTDTQWLDAFRAGGYPENTARRFIRRMKIKIAEGLVVQG